jgi:alpha-mannosidase
MLTAGDPILCGIEETAALMAHPVRIIDGTPQLPATGIALDIPGALISAVKPADDDTNDIIIRVWESRGGRSTGTINIAQATTVIPCDALENPTDAPLAVASAGIFHLSLRPFQIATLRIQTAH